MGMEGNLELSGCEGDGHMPLISSLLPGSWQVGWGIEVVQGWGDKSRQVGLLHVQQKSVLTQAALPGLSRFLLPSFGAGRTDVGAALSGLMSLQL